MIDKTQGGILSLLWLLMGLLALEEMGLPTLEDMGLLTLEEMGLPTPEKMRPLTLNNTKVIEMY